MGKEIKLPPVPVSDRVFDEILSLNKSLFVKFTFKEVFPVTLNVPPTVVFPNASTLKLVVSLID